MGGGAISDKQGLFEVADGSTFFLDGREVQTDWTAKESPFIYAVYGEGVIDGVPLKSGGFAAAAYDGAVSLLGELFPADPMVIGMLLAPLGLKVGPTVPTREWRELYAALGNGAS